jgi:hypothetical protein
MCVCLLIGLALALVCLVTCVQWRLFNSALGSGDALSVDGDGICDSVDSCRRLIQRCGRRGIGYSCTSYASDDVDRDGICGLVGSCISDPLTST